MKMECPDCEGKRFKVRRIIKIYQCCKCARIIEKTKKILNWKEKDAINTQKENKKFKRENYLSAEDYLR